MLDEDLPPQVVADAPLAGKTVVITGSIADPRSGEKVAAARVPAPVRARRRDHRLVGLRRAPTCSSRGADVGASKTAKAEKLGVEVVDQAEVWRLLIDAGVA